jgi:DNA polymerase
MITLSIDIETYSSVDLINCGVYKYTEAEDFEILLFAYAFDADEVQVIDLASGQVLPTLMRSVLMDKEVIKTAYNANFEFK